ncbi:uncharacterized protein LOC143809173 [Ranitomeya variabilis]|uniref:uncharacterized protein LOC143809173 n=1 Tax=Ranitomeya variabilis TaxID=490064 RepID=UPI004057A566
MEKLLQELLSRAGEEDGEDWLRSCLAIKPPLAASEAIAPPPVPVPATPEARHEAGAPAPERSPARTRRQSAAFSPAPSPAASGLGTSATSRKSRRSCASKSRSPPRDFGNHQLGAPSTSSGAAGRARKGTGRKSAAVPLSTGTRSALASAARGSRSAPPPLSSDEEEVRVPGSARQPRSPHSVGWSAGCEGGRRPDNQAARVIWIVGHSFVFWARKRASLRSYSENLSFHSSKVQVFWHGIRGLNWPSLVSEVKSCRERLPHPDLIIVHLAGNDLGRINTLNLLAAIRSDLTYLRQIFPISGIVFSEIIPRRAWQCTQLSFLDKIRKRVNFSMKKFLPLISGFSFRHTDLEGFLPGMFRNDLVHLSDIGLDLFNLNMGNIIEKWLCGLGGASAL